MELKRFNAVRAKFAPKKTDDLVNGSENAIGKVGEFTASWIIEDGEYVSQWAMVPSWECEKEFPFVWCPLSDLEVLEVID